MRLAWSWRRVGPLKGKRQRRARSARGFPLRKTGLPLKHTLSPCLFLPAPAACLLNEGIKTKKLNALRKALALYSTRLGLDFTSKDGEALKCGGVRTINCGSG